MQRIEAPKRSEDELLSYYASAAITLAWMSRDEQQYLVFGSLELAPDGDPPPSALPEQTSSNQLWKPKEPSTLLAVKRLVVTKSQGITWFNDLREGQARFPGASDDRVLEVGQIQSLTPWPSLVADSQTPVCGGNDRSYSLYDTSPNQILNELMDRPECLSWFSERLHIDLDRNRELVGSFHVVAMNPIFDGVGHRLHVDEAGKEYSAIELFIRPGQTPDMLNLIFAEKNIQGFVDQQVFTPTSRYILVEHQCRNSEAGYAITHRNLGLLVHSSPLPFLREISLTTSIGAGTNRIQVDSDDGENLSYEIASYHPADPISFGETNRDKKLLERLSEERHRRKILDEATHLGQVLFKGDRMAAREKIREIIGTARRRVLIFDPYFGAADLIQFALATPIIGTEVCAITSAKYLKTRNRRKSGGRAADELEAQLRKIPSSAKIEVLVLTGKTPPLHDRFLVIDNQVWFSGNSLNKIGERLSMLIRLPAPKQILNELEELVRSREKSVPFQEWIENRNGPTGPSGEH